MKYLLSLVCALVLTTTLYAQDAIRVQKTGSGQPVLFLPGFVTPGSVWHETTDHLEADTENHLVSYAGFNGIEPIDTPWYPNLMEELVAYIEKEDLQNLVIIGHSMGGMLAADLAAQVPDRVDKVVFVDALPCMRAVMMPGVPAESITYNNPYNNQTLGMNEAAFESMAQQMAMGMATDSLHQAHIKDWVLEADRKTYVYGYTDLLKLDLREKLGAIKADALVLGAPAFGAEVVRQNLEKQYANLENKEILIAPAGKHFIMMDQPEWFYQKVNTFLAE